MKGFYREKKKPKAGVTKSSPTKTKKRDRVIISHASLDLQDDSDKGETLLKQFDMNMAFGPCIGLTRLARWERAQRLRLNPPREVEGLLKGGKIHSGCLWGDRV
ncbi:hypothetical protein K2173_012204 [Erythroxylum novogranatense]|uniref:DNA polymerase delta subunit 4 n=1 Tax=Erythroxylum novogranatense TaxID=1862640 RepID=A0AAV8T7F0_9ROSI|nr:hypothetical protein K2173_012204 [Erythroxylum novogranatense]